MDSNLKQKIADDLRKSGFSSEMIVSSRLLASGWKCSVSGGYFDHDEKKSREIDIKAYFVQRTGKLRVSLEFDMFIEVKKSKAPWVVFRSRDEEDATAYWHNPSYADRLGFEPYQLSDVLGETSLGNKLGWLGYGVHEAFKSPNDTGRWFTAAVAASKASDHQERVYKEMGYPGKGKSFLVMCTPVVVLDGVLCSAQLDANNEEPLVEQIQYATVSLEYETESYTKRCYRVDLVQIDSLADYLKHQKKRAKLLFKKQCEVFDKECGVTGES